MAAPLKSFQTHVQEARVRVAMSDITIPFVEGRTNKKWCAYHGRFEVRDNFSAEQWAAPGRTSFISRYCQHFSNAVKRSTWETTTTLHVEQMRELQDKLKIVIHDLPAKQEVLSGRAQRQQQRDDLVAALYSDDDMVSGGEDEPAASSNDAGSNTGGRKRTVSQSVAGAVRMSAKRKGKQPVGALTAPSKKQKSASRKVKATDAEPRDENTPAPNLNRNPHYVFVRKLCERIQPAEGPRASAGWGRAGSTPIFPALTTWAETQLCPNLIEYEKEHNNTEWAPRDYGGELYHSMTFPNDLTRSWLYTTALDDVSCMHGMRIKCIFLLIGVLCFAGCCFRGASRSGKEGSGAHRRGSAADGREGGKRYRKAC